MAPSAIDETKVISTIDEIKSKVDTTELLKEQVTQEIIPEEKAEEAPEGKEKRVETKEIPSEKVEEIQVIEIDEGAILEITITLSREIPDIVWKKDVNIMHEDDRIKFIQDGGINKLIISNVTKDDSGIYSLEFAGNLVETKVVVNELKPEEIAPSAIDETKVISTVDEIESKVDTTELLEEQVTQEIIPEEKAEEAPEEKEKRVETKEIPSEKVEEIQVIEIDEGAILEITITLSREIPDIVWKKGVNIMHEDDRIKFIQDGGINKLIISNVTKDDSAIYSLEFVGNLVETKVVVNGKNKVESLIEEIPKEIKEIVVDEGATLDLTITLSKEPKKITWLKDDIELLEDGRVGFIEEGVVRKLVVSHVRKEDDGIYCLKIDDQEIKTKVTIREVPTEQLEEVGIIKIDEGTTLEITVTLSKDVPRVTWKKDSVQLLEDDRIHFVQDAGVHKLIISRAKLQDQGDYSLEFEGQEVKTKVEVSKAPLQEEEVKLIEVDEGSRLDLKVTLPTKIDKVIWKKDNAQILEDLQRITFHQDDTSQNLIIYNVKPDDEGLYSLEYDDQKVKTRVIVKKIPTEELEEIGLIKIDEGATLELTVTLSSDVPNVRWKKDSVQLLEDQRIQFIQDAGVHKLVISRVRPEDKGLYSLEFEGQEVKTQVDVEEMPKAEPEEMKVVEIDEGSELDLSVTLPRKSDKVTWSKDDVQILEDLPRLKFSVEDFTHKLIISNVKLEDEGVYALGFEDQKVLTKVIVKELPSETLEEIQEIEVEVGATLEITITLSRDVGQVKWRKDSVELIEDQRIKFIKEGVTYKLVVENVKLSDKGLYSLAFQEQEVKTKVKVIEPYEISPEKIKMEVSEPEMEISLEEKILRDQTPKEKVERADELVKQYPKEEGQVVFEKGLKDLELYEGDDLVLEVQLSQAVNPEDILWSHQDDLIKSDGMRIKVESVDDIKYKLTIRKSKPSDGGKYSCVYKSQKTTAQVMIKAIEETTFEKGLRDVEVNEGEDIILEVKLTKPVDAEDIVWSYQNRVIDRTEARVEFQSIDNIRYTLTIRKSKPSDGGMYSCSYKTQKTTSNVTVKVIEDAKFEKGLKDVVVNEGEDIVLEVKLTKPVNPEDIKWTHEEKTIEEDGHRTILENIDGIRYKLTIRKSKPSDEGFYSCSYKTQKTTSKVTVKVIEEAKFEKGLKDIEVYEGEDIVLEVKLTKPVNSDDIQWSHNEKTVEDDGVRIHLENIDNIIYKLTIRKSKTSDGGAYTCSYRTLKTSSKVTVKILEEEIKFEKGLQDLEVTEGQDIVLEVKLTKAVRPEEIEWAFDSKVVTDDGLRISVESADNIKYKLKIRKAKLSDGGSYTCSYKSQKTTSKVTVKVYGVPSKPENLAYEIQNTNINFTWKPPAKDGGSPITGYSVEVRETTSETWLRAGEVNANTLSFLFTDLSKSKTYRLRVKAINKVGSSPPAELDSDVTLKGISLADVPSPPRNLKGYPLPAKLTIKIDWDIPESDGGSEILGYIIELREASSQTWTHVIKTTTETMSITEHSSFTFESSKIQVEKEYYSRVFAYNEIGTSQAATTNVPVKVSKSLQKPSPPKGPLIIRETPEGSGDFELQWAAPDSDGGSPIKSYAIEISKNNGLTWEPAFEVPGDTTRGLLKNLEPNIDYLVRVIAKNDIGLSEPLQGTHAIRSLGEKLEPKLDSQVSSNVNKIHEYFYNFDLYSEDIPTDRQ